MNKKYVMVIAFCLIPILLIISSCANIEQATNSAKQKVNQIMSQTNSPTSSTAPKPIPSIMPNNLPAGSKCPTGIYTATSMGTTQTATFASDTITRYDPIDGEAIFKYYYLVNVPGKGYHSPANMDEVNTICIQDIVTRQVQYLDFKYIMAQDVVVIATIAYYKH